MNFCKIGKIRYIPKYALKNQETPDEIGKICATTEDKLFSSKTKTSTANCRILITRT